MHLRRLWTSLALLAAFGAGAAVVYKWTDADGVVHYSDQAIPGAEVIVTSSGSANGIAAGGVGAQAGSAPKKAAASGLNYGVLTIESPQKEQVFFGDEIVPVRLRLDPGLKTDHTIVWLLNGTQLADQSPTTTAFALQTLPRGAYSLAATITDAVSGQSQSAESITFYVKQPSELSPQHRKP